MDEGLLSRGQRREMRRREMEKTMTLERFTAKARNAGLVYAGHIKVNIIGHGVVEFVLTEIQNGQGVRVSWQTPGGPLCWCDVFKIEQCQAVISDLGAGKLPGEG